MASSNNPNLSSSIRLPEMKWQRDTTYSRLMWNLNMLAVIPFFAGLILIVVVMLTEPHIETLPPILIFMEVLVSVILGSLIPIWWMKKKYRYTIFYTTIPESWDGNAQESKSLLIEIFEELLEPQVTEKTLVEKKQRSIVIFSFPNNSCTIELWIPNRMYPNLNAYVLLQVIEKDDFPILLEIKELIELGMDLDRDTVFKSTIRDSFNNRPSN